MKFQQDRGQQYATHGLVYICAHEMRCSVMEGLVKWFNRSCWFVGWLQLQASLRLKLRTSLTTFHMLAFAQPWRKSNPIWGRPCTVLSGQVHSSRLLSSTTQ
jgi:hypothetical protein